jgi:hypothetical protein
VLKTGLVSRVKKNRSYFQGLKTGLVSRVKKQVLFPGSKETNVAGLYMTWAAFGEILPVQLSRDL